MKPERNIYEIVQMFLFVWIVIADLAVAGQAKQPVDYVDPFMGTSESRMNQFPGATMPFGMVQLSPNNQMDVWFGGYEYTISSVHGFSHFQAEAMDGLSVMPTVGSINPIISAPDQPSSGRYGVRSPINKNTEKASPGYYSVDLINYEIKTELTGTTRCGFFRFTFPETDKANAYFHLQFPSEKIFVKKCRKGVVKRLKMLYG